LIERVQPERPLLAAPVRPLEEAVTLALESKFTRLAPLAHANGTVARPPRIDAEVLTVQMRLAFARARIIRHHRAA
jgi:hypothetical protein